MSAAEEKARLAAALYHCRFCSEPADHKCVTGKVGPPRRVKRGNVEKDVQEFLAYYVCDGHVRAALDSDDPPRSVVALPHMAASRRAERAARTKRERAALAEASQRFGDDWGKRPPRDIHPEARDA